MKHLSANILLCSLLICNGCDNSHEPYNNGYDKPGQAERHNWAKQAGRQEICQLVKDVYTRPAPNSADNSVGLSSGDFSMIGTESASKGMIKVPAT